MFSDINISFLFVLTALVLISGVIGLVDKFVFEKIRKKQTPEPKMPILAEYSRSFFPVLLIVLLLRSFVIQPYRVPTGSLEPTIMPGDLIAVSMYNYGLRLPIWHKKILNIGEPKVGDITLVRWPVNNGETFIKRVIGVPGDSVSYQNKILYINGKEAKQVYKNMSTDNDGYGPTWPVKVMQEDINGVKHGIYLRPDRKGMNFKNLIIPKGEYLLMGDNRDNSDDGRYWGLVPEKDLIGKAFLVWFSWDSQTDKVRWDQIGKWL